MELALPKEPDFSVNPEDIIFTPQYPVSGQPLNVKIRLHNLGKVFPNDSVNVKLIVSSNDTSFVLKNIYRSSFGENDSISFDWTTHLVGNITFRLGVNENNKVPEIDHSDNVATQSVYIFNLGQPDIIFPFDGFSSNLPVVNFLFSDIGEYINQNLSYSIEIDTALNFNSPQLISTEVFPADGTLKWKSPQLPDGYYFWRARVKDSQGNIGSWSTVRTFSINQESKKGFYAENKLLKNFEISNMNYSDISNSLELNKNVLPPRPSDDKFIEDVNLNSSILDSVNLTSITTDGTYIYLANIADYAYVYNQTGNSEIYKIGTGYNSTVKGRFYGAIPNFYNKIVNQFFYYTDGFIYVPYGNKYKLLKVSPNLGVVDTITIPDGMIKENMKGAKLSILLLMENMYIT